ncbi:MAG: aspartate aminotransferase family protein [Deltaproteobacteria bacterium]|nr:aspartate aminotransferase family protein [Deltaproteobacteria bacterium]
MPLDQWLHAATDHPLARYSQYVNPQFAKVLRTIGFDIAFTRANGAYLYDARGNQYLDCLAGYGVFNMGRNHPRIKAALQRALELDLPNMLQMHAPPLAGLLAERLLARVALPALDTVFFTNSGTEAVEAAIKFAKCATGRGEILCTEHAFHGLTNGSLSCNGNAEFRDGFEPLLPGRRVPFGDLDALRTALASRTIAAFIVEPIQGKGVYTAPTTYFNEAIHLCRQHGTLVIADEVQTGLGRTGRWFACQAWQEPPDLLCVAKALSGGYVPVGALCYSRTIYDRVYSSMDRCVVHSNTFGRNTLAMVAGLAALEVTQDDGLVENAVHRGRAILDGLRTLATEFEMIKEVRGEGCMIGIEFGEPQSLRLRTGWKLIHTLNANLFGQLIVVPLFTKHRILTQVAGHNAIVKLLPPLTLGDADVEHLLTALRAVIAEAHRFPGGVWDVGMDLAKRALRAS